MFLQATKSIIPVQTLLKIKLTAQGDFNEGVHIDCMVIPFGFVATAKNVPDIFFSTWIMDHLSWNMQRIILHAPVCKALYLRMPNVIIAAPSGVTLEETIFVPKNFKLFTVVYASSQI